MKTVVVIPARYQSSRLPGKMLYDLCGKPMLWWVYQQAKKAENVDEVIIATDSNVVKNACEGFGATVILTSDKHKCNIERIQEVSDYIKADYYISVNGDEPLIESENISKVIPNYTDNLKPVVAGLMRNFVDPVEVVDPGNIKIVVNDSSELMYASRNPVPYPHRSAQYKFKKYVGIECYNKAALDFYVKTPMPTIEYIEDVAFLRFVEHHINVQYTLVESDSLSVDTKRDLEKVEIILERKING